MPSKNITREYMQNGIYHVYNRGINKQDIFLDNEDYVMFLFYLKLYLDNPDNQKRTDLQKRKYLERKNFFEEVELLSYCLMPNHYHLLLKQHGNANIPEIMKCLMVNYVMYFNKKYKRVGSLFQGKYKAALVMKDEYLLHLSRYIHQNPIAKGRTLGKMELERLREYPYSSYSIYLGNKKTDWVNSDLILKYFESSKNNMIEKVTSYQQFVEEYSPDSEKILDKLILEEE